MITLIVIIGLAVLILGHEFGHFITAKLSGMRVDEFGIGFPPRIWKKKIGETTYSVNLLPFGGFVKIAGENDGVMDKGKDTSGMQEAEKKRYFSGQPAWKRSIVILAGVVMNLALGWVMLSLIFMIGSGPSLAIGLVEPGSPAEKAGLKPGDMVQGYSEVQKFISYVHENAGHQISLIVKRGDKEMNIQVTPRTETTPDQGPIGVVFAGIPRLGPVRAVQAGFEQSVEMVKMTFLGFKELFGGLISKGSLPSDIVGPVGIFGIAQDAGSLGLLYLLQLLAFISINLGVINLMPFPALDGGRFLFILIEKLKGSPIPQRVEAALNVTGFALLILLMLAVTIRDVIRL